VLLSAGKSGAYRSIRGRYDFDSGSVLLHGLVFINLFVFGLVLLFGLEVPFFLGRSLSILLYELFFVIGTLIEGLLFRLGRRHIAE
jgi:hypothetical protein